MRQDLVESASSERAANVVLVKKKTGELRFCIDYRMLNEATKKDAYNLPRIDEYLDAMSGARWFPTFDLRSGYHQVLLDLASSDKTTFISREGTFRFKVMPFGLCNAPATFQRLMNLMMSGLKLQICLVYLDDIIVFSKELPDHVQRLRKIFERLRVAQLKLKHRKCKELQRRVGFLGYVVSEAGIATDLEKIKSVETWPTPTSLKEVRSFLGLCSYHRRFVKGFSEIATPLHRFAGENVSFIWTPECQQAFEELRLALTTTPVLAMPTD